VIKPTSLRRRSAGLARHFALALALAAGGAVLTVPGLADPAMAQKKKDEPKGAAKPVISKEFLAAYQPLNKALEAPGADIPALKPQLLALKPLAQSADEKQALGAMIFNAGITAKDEDLEIEGIDLMLSSGKLAQAEAARFNVVGFQIATGRKQFDQARAYLQAAIDLGFSSPNASTDDLRLNYAELYFSEERYADGLTYLADLIAARKAAGSEVPLKWYRRAVSVAYTNEIVPQVYEFAAGWVTDYPSPESWRDAVNLTRNLNEFESQPLLDLLRLGRKIGTFKGKNDYIAYIESADARRLPGEVKAVIEEAYANGTIPRGSDSFVDDQYRLASDRAGAERAEMVGLERDANAASAQLRTVVAAGDVFLSNGENAKAAGFYQKALGMAGVDRDHVLTRLGMALIGTGDIAGAREALANVGGARLPVARLWAAYAAQQGAAASGG